MIDYLQPINFTNNNDFANSLYILYLNLTFNNATN